MTNPGYVYFIKAGETGLIKIGWSVQPGARLDGLQCASPVNLYPMAIMPGGREDEASLHQRFATDRVRREWFRPSVSLLLYIHEHAQPWVVAPQPEKRVSNAVRYGTPKPPAGRAWADRDCGSHTRRGTLVFTGPCTAEDRFLQDYRDDCVFCRTPLGDETSFAYMDDDGDYKNNQVCGPCAGLKNNLVQRWIDF